MNSCLYCREKIKFFKIQIPPLPSSKPWQKVDAGKSLPVDTFVEEGQTLIDVGYEATLLDKLDHSSFIQVEIKRFLVIVFYRVTIVAFDISFRRNFGLW